MMPTELPLREFLLRRLSESEAGRVEEALLTQDGVAEQLREAEYDLLDEYARGGLSAAERLDVDRHLLDSPEAQHALRVAGLMAKEQGRSAASAASPRRAEQSWPRRSPDAVRRWRRLAPAGALLAAGIAALAWIPWAGHPPAASAGLEGGAARPGTITPDAALPILTLLAETERGSADSALRWQAGAGTVRLQAEIPAPDPQALYSLQIADPSGATLFESPPLSPRTAGRYRFVDAVVPTSALGAGARRIRLHRSDASPAAAADYTWRVSVTPE